ncbi:hypothetical protein O7635_19840 [Asanoa sp. WMMD1127]|uniref:hypothetical protein n=1 Tax=Asanoa sp. WMMD1127 TaxID=3016107 RepID=UPI002417F3EB|nr:hypothetical protein [Asanoa sp. WMMD1127]MDG4824110.1 hypothetical protein [Asanoa sp. WMMD1127]
MDAKLLVKQFNTDAGLAFIEIIRAVDRPVGAREIKQEIVAAGGKQGDVDRQWKRLQPYLKLHPHVEKSGATRYEWSAAPHSSAESLQLLSAQSSVRVPGWLTQALAANVADSLAVAETSGDRAQASWTRQREQDKARVLADLATVIGAMRAEGATLADLDGWLRDETERKRLRPVAQVGETVTFDPDRHEIAGGRAARGAAVTVTRTGYLWQGGDGPVVLVKATVAP